VLGWSWDSVVLAATYRGLFQGYTKTVPVIFIAGCSLLLQLWSYVRFMIVRLGIDLRAYEDVVYHVAEEDIPMMGSL
jgi:hypothetical protein